MNKKLLISVGFLSNVFEWYDFSIYAYLAVIIGGLFFPSENEKMAYVKVFFVFSLSYLIRPIGSVFFGYLADRYSRQKSLQLSLLMMAIPTVMIGLLPTQANIGVSATFLLIVLRLVQGFAAGGELPGSACYIYEMAPDKKKVFYCSFVASSSMLGVLSGSTMVSILYWTLNQDQLLSWGWRIPFLIGALIAIFIFYVRNNMPEPEKEFSKTTENYEKTVQGIKSNAWPLGQVILLNAFISIAFYLLFVWMPSYLQIFLNVKAKQALLSSTLALSALIIFTLIFGYLADKIGRKTLALSSIFSIFILAYPLFTCLKEGTFLLILLTQLLFALCLSFIDGINMESMASRFKQPFRARGMGIGFTLSTALFGGTAPLICSYLIARTGSDISPILFLMLAGVIALPAAFSLKQR